MTGYRRQKLRHCVAVCTDGHTEARVTDRVHAQSEPYLVRFRVSLGTAAADARRDESLRQL
jgi:hypothetical protein